MITQIRISSLVRVIGLFLTLVLALSACAPALGPAPASGGGEAAPAPEEVPTPQSFVVGVAPVGQIQCISFEAQQVGVTYKVGNVFGESGVTVVVRPFQWSDGQWTTDGYAEIQDQGMAGGSGQDVWTNNVNLAFDFGGPLEALTLQFGAHGGNLNIEINSQLQNLTDFSAIDGMTIGGVNVSVNQDSIELSGEIYSFAIGGQELAIDDVCPTPRSASIDCVTFEVQQVGVTYKVGNVFGESGVTIVVRPFQWSDGQWTTDGYAEIQDQGMAGGSGQDVWTNNVNLAFDFGGPLEALTLRFGAHGGNLNIEINSQLQNLTDFSAIDGMTIGGVNVSVNQDSIELSGEIYSFAIGGQELAIDDVCPTPRSASIDCISFEAQQVGVTYKVGNVFGESGVTIIVRPFQWSDGQWTADGYAEIQNQGMAGGSGQDVWTNNVNLAFDFGGPLEALTLRFGAHGGNLNIEINGQLQNLTDFSAINGMTVGGVNVSVNQDSIELSGEIYSFAIGGQEFAIDDVCP